MSNDKLDELYNALIDKLLELVKSGEVKGAELNVARQFLKDQDYSGDPQQHSGLNDLFKSVPFPEPDPKKDQEEAFLN